jgi:hypothetical protein
MSGVTTNYGYILPAKGEGYDVGITNQNMTAIDEDIKAETTKYRHAEYSRAGQNDNPAGTPWGMGNYTALLDIGQSINYADMIDYPANDRLRFLIPGVYSITWKLVPTTSTTIWHAIKDITDAVTHGRSVSAVVPANDSIFAHAPNFHVPASAIGTDAAIVQLKASIAAAGTVINHRVKVTKVG